MPRYENLDKDGNVTDVFLVDEQTLKDDPEAVLKSRGPLKSRAPAAPEGYEHIATTDNDPDALVSGVSVHVYARKGAFHKEKPSKLSGLKAVVAEAEERKEVEGAPPAV
jgi:hypothetical protein